MQEDDRVNGPLQTLSPLQKGSSTTAPSKGESLLHTVLSLMKENKGRVQQMSRERNDDDPIALERQNH